MIKKLLLFTLGILLYAAGYSQPSSSIVDQVQRAVVKVESGGKVGTGFCWKRNDQVVTALHLIEDQYNITVTSINGVRSARVSKLLKAQDLVLLTLDSPLNSSIRNLSNVNFAPQQHADIYTVGYNGAGSLNNVIDRSMKLGFSRSKKLEGLISEKDRTALRQCMSPDPGIDVHYIDGSIVPGFSGAPVVDFNGNLIGIADGGLERGASSVSWAIPATQLSLLERSTEVLTARSACSSASGKLFSADRFLEAPKIIEFLGYTYVKTKTRTVAEMRNSIDDPKGLDDLLQQYASSLGPNYINLRYDIYEDVSTGGVICVPENTELKLNKGRIEAHFPKYDLTFIASASVVWTGSNNVHERYQKRINEFKKLVQEFQGKNLTYQLDIVKSYLQPIVQSNYMRINRVGYFGYDALNLPRSSSFQKHVGKQQNFLGAAIVNNQWTQAYINSISTCVKSGRCQDQLKGLDCVIPCDKAFLEATLIIGVQMTGFSNAY